MKCQRTATPVVALVAAASLVIIGVAPAAVTNGGASIANAPEMPIGQHIASGWANATNGEFWRVPLNAGDRFTMDVGSTADNCTLHWTVYPASTTDYTLDHTSAVGAGGVGIGAKTEWVWLAPSAGHWILHFWSCSTNSYEFTSLIQSFTRVNLSAPRLAEVNRSLRVSGRVDGVTSGKVALKATAPGVKLSKVTALKAGKFSWSFRPKTRASYKIRVNYYGDSSHRPSAASTVVRIG